MNLYIPPGARNLSESAALEQQIRLGLQGFPGTGKTYAALTFPNPIVINLDRGLGAHVGRKDVIEVPFWDFGFCRRLDNQYHPSKLKDVLVKWLDGEGDKFTSEQTLVVDGNTGIQNAYHKWFEVNGASFVTKGGKINDFAEWQVKRAYFGEIMEMFKRLKCNIVYLCHEADQKEKGQPGQPALYLGKVRPLLSGSFGDELISHFTDWFRCHAMDKPNYATWTDDQTKQWSMTKQQHEQWTKEFPRNTMYYWQTESDQFFDGKSSSMVNFPRFVPASYNSLVKYRRKIS